MYFLLCVLYCVLLCVWLPIAIWNVNLLLHISMQSTIWLVDHAHVFIINQTAGHVVNQSSKQSFGQSATDKSMCCSYICTSVSLKHYAIKVNL